MPAQLMAIVSCMIYSGVMSNPSHEFMDARQTADEDAEPSAIARAVAHWSVYLPAVVVGVIYGGVWLLMLSQDKVGGAIGRLMLLVCAVVVPLLLVHAFLRYMSTCVTVTKSEIILERGWPRRIPVTVALGDVSQVVTARPVLGRFLGAGTLILSTRKNERFVVNDLGDPDSIADAYRRLTG